MTTIRAPGRQITVGPGVQKLNPHLFAKEPHWLDGCPELKPIVSKHRIRQSSKPLLNRLEAEWLVELERRYGPGVIHSQAKKFKLGNNCWYCPDFTVMADLLGNASKEMAWEVKGKHAWDDALVKLKVAAHQWPEVDWRIAWKDADGWHEQMVLP